MTFDGTVTDRLLVPCSLYRLSRTTLTLKKNVKCEEYRQASRVFRYRHTQIDPQTKEVLCMDILYVSVINRVRAKYRGALHCQCWFCRAAKVNYIARLISNINLYCSPIEKAEQIQELA